jgi:hypothetical protein
MVEAVSLDDWDSLLVLDVLIQALLELGRGLVRVVQALPPNPGQAE